MGYWKDLLIEQQERGYSSIGNKHVCGKCFSDYALSQFVTENATEKHCDYCGRVSRVKPIAAPIDDILAEIADGIRSEWGTPEAEGVPYESREGGWQGKVIDSWDLFHEEVEGPFANDDLLKDVIDAFSDRQWCQKDFYCLKPDEAIRYGWEEFVEVVKHKVRYLFSLAPDESSEFRGSEEIPPSAFLTRVGDLISETGLVRNLSKGIKVFRARVHDPQRKLTTAVELGPPPDEAARFSNRMSPAGIPMFYGAFDIETALTETYEARRGGQKAVTIGCFKTAREFPVLDLTTLPGVPSLFDSHKRHLRPGLIFMHRFATDLSAQIEKDGREHIEYVPTQIFTEYVRRLYKHPSLGHVRGIIYYSAQAENGKCCVLFFLSEECCEIHRKWREMLREYSTKPRWWLGMMPRPIVRNFAARHGSAASS